MYVYQLGSKIFEHFTGWEKCTLLFKEHLLALSVPTLQRWVQLSTFTSSVCHGDIFYLTDHSQLTLAPAQASVPPHLQTGNPILLPISPSPLSTTFLYTASIPVSLHQVSFFPSSFTFHLLLVWKCSLETVAHKSTKAPQMLHGSHCVGRGLTHCSHPSSKKERILLINDTGGPVFLTELKRVWFYSLDQLQNVLRRTFPFTKSDLHLLLFMFSTRLCW